VLESGLLPIARALGRAQVIYLRPLRLRERGLPFGRRVGFGTTLGLRFGTVRLRGAVLPGERRARFYNHGDSKVRSPPLINVKANNLTAGRAATFFLVLAGLRAGALAGVRGFFAGGALVFAWLRGTVFLGGALFNGQAGAAGALAPARGALTTRDSSDERGSDEKRRSMRRDGAAKSFEPPAGLPPQAALRLHATKRERVSQS